MKIKTHILPIAFITSLMYGCDNSDSPYALGSGSTGSGTNIVSEKGFNVAYDGDFSVITGTGIDAGVEVTVNVSTSDNAGLIVSGATVYLAVDWGTLSASSCVTDITGTCSITWTSRVSNNTGYLPADESITFTGWVIGEESYSDLNASGVFDDGDVFLNDTTGPFLDLDHSGDYSAGDQLLSPGNTNGILTAADGLYNGAGCSHSTLCSTTTQVYVSDRDIVSIRE